jgi:hypothetical protein
VAANCRILIRCMNVKHLVCHEHARGLLFSLIICTMSVLIIFLFISMYSIQRKQLTFGYLCGAFVVGDVKRGLDVPFDNIGVEKNTEGSREIVRKIVKQIM